MPSARQYTNNPNLSSPNAPADWKGTPLDDEGRFSNLNHPFDPDWLDVFKWKCGENPYKEEKKAEIWNPEIFRDDSWLGGSEDTIVWLGHSTFFIRLNGIQILTDPVFGNILSVKRHSEFPLAIHKLSDIDYVLLSHDHRDHLDRASLKILSKQNEEARYLTGLGMKALTEKLTGSQYIEEAGWYQRYNTDTRLKITFVPSRHWSKRGLNDTNKRLWGGFVIEVPGKRILFGGDSGYDTHFKQLGEAFGGFDYAILGIGAFEPKWFMSANHQSPEDAVNAFQELNSRYMIPMHYGTFDLSDEPMGQPLKELKLVAKERDLTNRIVIPEIGKPLKI